MQPETKPRKQTMDAFKRTVYGLCGLFPAKYTVCQCLQEKLFLINVCTKNNNKVQLQKLTARSLISLQLTLKAKHSQKAQVHYKETVYAEVKRRKQRTVHCAAKYLAAPEGVKHKPQYPYIILGFSHNPTQLSHPKKKK